MWPKAVQYMVEASKNYVGMLDLRRKAGEVAAKAAGAEAGCVTCGCASAIIHSMAAFMTGTDLYKIHLIPDTSRLPKNEILVQRNHQYRWIRSTIMVTGAKIATPGDSIGHPFPELSPNYIEGELSMNPKIAGIYHSVAPTRAQAGEAPLPEVIEIAHKHGVPVFVDCAPFGYDLKRYIAMGADLAGYSGGKFLGAPSNSGFVVGRKNLIEACELQWYGIGRPLKFEKEVIMGLVGALEEYVARGSSYMKDTERRKDDLAQLDYIEKGLKSLPRISLRYVHNPIELDTGRFPDELFIGLESPKDAGNLVKALKAGDPEIEVGWHTPPTAPGRLSEIWISPVGLLEGEDDIVVQRIRELWPYKN
jgi:seryl-tRNA(Sec) selenium transferase